VDFPLTPFSKVRIIAKMAQAQSSLAGGPTSGLQNCRLDEPATWRTAVLWFIGACLLVFASGCQEKSIASTDQNPLTNTPLRSVRVVTAAKRNVERTVTVLGSLKAKQEVLLSAKVPGRLQTIHVDIGSRVKTGDLIARIDPRDYEIKVKQAEAALAQARARLGLSLDGRDEKVDLEKISSVKEAKAVYDEARLTRERAAKLETEKLIPQSERDSAEASYNVALNRYQTALDEGRFRLAALAQKHAELDLAREELAAISIVAPFDAVVQVRHANPGAYLKEGDPLVALVQVDPLRLHLEVPEPEAPRIRLGQEVRFMVTGETEERVAQITRISPQMDNETRMLIVEADVPNDGSLRAGAFAQARIVVQAQSAALVVPPEAIRVFAGVQKTFVLQDDKAIEKEITTGNRTSDWVEILTGLKEGERVILGPGGLRSGDRVAIARSGQPAS
jgi:membrane fusion protein, multidrug efflux system